MKSGDYRIESSHPVSSRLLPKTDAFTYFFWDGALAVAMAAKSVTTPAGKEIRVIHVPTGEVIFLKSAEAAPPILE